MIENYSHNMQGCSSNRTKIIELVLNHTCNFRCNYCYTQYEDEAYSNQKVMNSETLERVIQYILKEYSITKNNGQMLYLSILGGEPMLMAKSLTKIFESIYDTDIKVTVYTNGSLISKNKKLIKTWRCGFNDFYRFAFAISFDYVLNNKNRCKNSYNKVVDAIKWLDDNNIQVKTVSAFNTEDLNQFHNVFGDFDRIQSTLKNNRFPFQFQVNRRNGIHIPHDAHESLGCVGNYIIANNIPIKHYKSKTLGGMKNKRYNCGLGWRVICGIDYDGGLYPCNGAIWGTSEKSCEVFKYATVYDSYDDIVTKRTELTNKVLSNLKEHEKCQSCNNICKVCPLTKVTDSNSFDKVDSLPSDDVCELFGLMSQCLYAPRN